MSQNKIEITEEAKNGTVNPGRYYRQTSSLCTIEEECEDLTFDSKTANRIQYCKHRGGRRNVRESKRREQRKKKRREALRKQRRFEQNKFKPDNGEPDQKKILPHSDEIEIEKHPFNEEPSNIPLLGPVDLPLNEPEEEEISEEQLLQTRNEMAHIVANTKATDKTDEKLASLLSSIGSIENLAEGHENEQIEEWIGHLENLVILGYQMSRASSFMDVFMSVVAYAKMYSKSKSIALDMYRIINELTETIGPEVVEPHGWKDWTGRDVLDKWELFKTNTIFKKISYLITAAMSLTVCTTKKVEWSPFGLQLISLEAAKEQLRAVDVIDALVKTFVWTSEVGWKCFETRSIAPILYSDVKIQEYNENCDWVLAKADAACAGNIEDLGEYENKLNAVFKKTCAMKAAKNDGPTSVWLQKRYSDLVSISERLSAKRKNTNLRFQPIGWSLHGGTSVGKSTLGLLTMQQSLAAMGFVKADGTVDKDRILTKDFFDKYDSTWTFDIIGVFLDDLNNTKAEFTETPHTAVIIKFFNNVAAQAVKAELNAKGVVFIDFKVGVVTSNVKDLGARQFSNCPESILRRLYHVEVVVKEKFRKTGSLTLNKKHPEIKGSANLIADVWDIKIEEVLTYEVSPGQTSYKFEPLIVTMDDGRTLNCKQLGLEDYLSVVIQLSKDHKSEQDDLLRKNAASAQASFCPVCKRFPEYCRCSKLDDDDSDDSTCPGLEPDKLEPHAVDILANVARSAVRQAIDGYIKSWTRPVDLFNWCVGFSPIRYMATNALAKEIQHEMNEKGTPLLVAITPEWLFRTSTFQRTIAAWQSGTAYYDIRRPLRFASMISFSLMGYGLIRRNKPVGMSGVSMLWSTTVLGYFWHRVRVAQIRSEYVKKRDALPDYAKHVRDGDFPKGVLFVATLALGVKLISMWNDNRIKTDPQSLAPADIDAQPGWFGYMMNQIGWKSESSVKGAIPEHVLSTGQKNLGWCDFVRSDGSKTCCNIVYPEKGYVWFPLHIFYPGCNMNEKPVDFVRGEVTRNDSVTSKFKFVAQLGVNTVSFEGMDMVECFVERCPDITSNLVKFLPLKVMSGTSVCTLMLRTKDAKLEHDKVAVTHGVYGHMYKTMPGGSYTTSKAVKGSYGTFGFPRKTTCCGRFPHWWKSRRKIWCHADNYSRTSEENS
jgi:hypothetical protein